MRWSKITAVLNILLLAVNLFLIYNLNMQYSNTFLISTDSIEKTVNLLKKSNIYITETAIPRNKPDYKIYEGKFFTKLEEYYINTVKKLTGNNVTDDFTSHMINNGIRIIENTKGEIFEFYSDDIFSFKYMKDEGAAYDGYVETDDAKECVYDDNINNITVNKLWELEKIIEKKFSAAIEYKKSSDFEKINIDVKINKIYFNAEDNLYTVTFAQLIDGLEIYSCNAVCVISEGTMVYARGNLILTEADVNYNTELYDQISILFNEKVYIEQQKADEYNTVSQDSIPATDKYEITCFKSVYCINWNEDRSNFYLIPAWYIEYNGSEIRIRNAVNGNIYTI